MFTASTNNGEKYCIIHNYQLQSCNGSQEEVWFICRADNPLGYEMTATMTIFNDGKNNF